MLLKLLEEIAELTISVVSIYFSTRGVFTSWPAGIYRADTKKTPVKHPKPLRHLLLQLFYVFKKSGLNRVIWRW